MICFGIIVASVNRRIAYRLTRVHGQIYKQLEKQDVGRCSEWAWVYFGSELFG